MARGSCGCRCSSAVSATEHHGSVYTHTMTVMGEACWRVERPGFVNSRFKGKGPWGSSISWRKASAGALSGEIADRSPSLELRHNRCRRAEASSKAAFYQRLWTVTTPPAARRATRSATPGSGPMPTG